MFLTVVEDNNFSLYLTFFAFYLVFSACVVPAKLKKGGGELFLVLR